MTYVTCPRCKGERTVFAYTRLGDGYRPSQGEYFSCPLCCGTGEAEEQEAKSFMANMVSEDEASA